MQVLKSIRYYKIHYYFRNIILKITIHMCDPAHSPPEIKYSVYMSHHWRFAKIINRFDCWSNKNNFVISVIWFRRDLLLRFVKIFKRDFKIQNNSDGMMRKGPAQTLTYSRPTDSNYSMMSNYGDELVQREG